MRVLLLNLNSSSRAEPKGNGCNQQSSIARVNFAIQHTSLMACFLRVEVAQTGMAILCSCVLGAQVLRRRSIVNTQASSAGSVQAGIVVPTCPLGSALPNKDHGVR